jgi:hypothetical protein
VRLTPTLRWTIPWLMAIALNAMAFVATAGQPLVYGQSGSGSLQISIDSPLPGATLRAGEQITFGGWAVDATMSGVVETVELFIDGQPGQGGISIGRADYGGARPDVAAALGNQTLANVGFDLNWKVTGAGSRTVYVFAYSPAHGWGYEELTLNVEESTTPTTGQDELSATPAAHGFASQPGYPSQGGLANPAYAPSAGQVYGTMSPEMQYGTSPNAAYPPQVGGPYAPSFPGGVAGAYPPAQGYGYAPPGGLQMAPPYPAGAQYGPANPYPAAGSPPGSGNPAGSGYPMPPLRGY